jgi:hypothetical protein
MQAARVQAASVQAAGMQQVCSSPRYSLALVCLPAQSCGTTQRISASSWHVQCPSTPNCTTPHTPGLPHEIMHLCFGCAGLKVNADSSDAGARLLRSTLALLAKVFRCVYHWL